MIGGGRGKSGERSCYFPVINRTRCVDDVRAAGKLGPRPVTFLAATMLILNLLAVVEHAGHMRPEAAGLTNCGLLLNHADRARMALSAAGGQA